MTDYRPKNILVTGGAGFIGSNYVHHMLAHYPEINIVNLDKLTYAGSRDNLMDLPDQSRHIFIQGDICDAELVSGILEQQRIDCIVHFAAESHVDRSISAPAAFVQSNILGTFTLLEAARVFWGQTSGLSPTQCRFHHISTDEVFGSLELGSRAFCETSIYQPSSPYSASKAGSDHLVKAWHHTYGLPITLSYCSNNYGPRQHREKFIPTIIEACLRQAQIPVYGNGSNIRDWLYVEDHCSAIDRILRYGNVGEAYNIGGNNEWANLDICHLICDLMDQRMPANAPHRELIKFVDDRPGHDWRYAIDATKITAELGWSPRETFSSGIARVIDQHCQQYSAAPG